MGGLSLAVPLLQLHSEVPRDWLWMFWVFPDMLGGWSPAGQAGGSDLGVQRGLLCTAMPLRAHQPRVTSWMVWVWLLRKGKSTGSKMSLVMLGSR